MSNGQLIEDLGKFLYDNGEEDDEEPWEEFTERDKEYWYALARRAIRFISERGPAKDSKGFAAFPAALKEAIELCPRKKCGEYNMLKCVRHKDHDGECVFVVDASEYPNQKQAKGFAEIPAVLKEAAEADLIPRKNLTDEQLRRGFEEWWNDVATVHKPNVKPTGNYATASWDGWCACVQFMRKHRGE